MMSMYAMDNAMRSGLTCPAEICRLKKGIVSPFSRRPMPRGMTVSLPNGGKK